MNSCYMFSSKSLTCIYWNDCTDDGVVTSKHINMIMINPWSNSLQLNHMDKVMDKASTLLRLANKFTY